MELKHDGLDNEGFGNEGWVDSCLGINIFYERVGGSIRRIPLDNTGSTNARMTSTYGCSSMLMMKYLEFLILFMYMLVF